MALLLVFVCLFKIFIVVVAVVFLACLVFFFFLVFCLAVLPRQKKRKGKFLATVRPRGARGCDARAMD